MSHILLIHAIPDFCRPDDSKQQLDAARGEDLVDVFRAIMHEVVHGPGCTGDHPELCHHVQRQELQQGLHTDITIQALQSDSRRP